jgi:hypothetical protein
MNTTANSPAPVLEPATVVPSLGHLAFEIGLPADWQKLPLPEEAVDFDRPTAFLPPGVFMANYGAIVFSVAAPVLSDFSDQDPIPGRLKGLRSFFRNDNNPVPSRP